jgi:competence protein ComEA
MSRRSLPPRSLPRRTPGRTPAWPLGRTPGTEPQAGVSAARHRLSATLGVPEDPGSGTGLLAAVPAADPFAGHPDGPGPAAPGVRRRTGLRGAALLGVVAAVLAGWFWWQAGAGAPEVVPLSDVSSAGVQQQDVQREDNQRRGTVASADSSPPREGAGPDPGRITVHVAGAVVRPGVVELPSGSRLHEALTAAGGATGSADPDRLNLAAVLEDGQKILVPERGQPEDPLAGPAGPADPGSAGTGGTGGGGTASGGASGGGKININTADVEELGRLPRVGPVLAQRIVDWRKQHGRFQTVNELDAVDGVGPKLLEALLPLVRV